MGPGVPDPGTGMPPVNGQNTTIGGIPLGTPDGSAFISYSPFGNYALDSRSSSPYVNYSTYADPAPIDGTNPYSVPPVYRVDSAGAAGRIEIDLTDKLVLTSITGFRQYKGDWSSDEGTPVGTYLLHNTVSNVQGSEELRLTGKLFRDAVDFTVGGFYLYRKSSYGGRISLRTLQFVEDDEIPATTAAGFANVEWHLLDALDLVLGGRYTYQEKSFHYGRDFVEGSPGNPGLEALDGTVGKFEGDRFDYRGAVQYQWIRSFMTYAQVASGFKGGGVNPRPFDQSQVLPHDPETLIAYELGFKSDWLDRRLRFNGAGFFNQYNDILMTVAMCPAPATTAPCFLPINAGKANVSGVEFEGVARPLRGLELEATMAFLNFKYDSISAQGQSSGITLDMTGPFVPKWQASAGARYEVLLGSAGSLTPRLDLIYQDSFFTLPTNTSFSLVDSRTVLNGRVTWTTADETWQTSLELSNITNALYYYNVRDDRASSYTVTGQPAPPFRWAVSIKRNFL
jgi:iron complex outermembrane receptor protein